MNQLNVINLTIEYEKASYERYGSHYSRSGFWRDRGGSTAPKGSSSQAKEQKSTDI